MSATVQAERAATVDTPPTSPEQKLESPEERRRHDQRCALIFWCTVFAWLLFFMLGTWMPSSTLIETVMYGKQVDWLSVDPPLVKYPFYAVLAFVSWSLTNIAILCGLSSTIGEMFRVWWRRESEPDIRQATARAFIIFLLMVTGQLVILGNVTGAPGGAVTTSELTQSQYVRIAGFASMLCFLCSAHPKLILTIMDRIEAAVAGTNADSGVGPTSNRTIAELPSANETGFLPAPPEEFTRPSKPK